MRPFAVDNAGYVALGYSLTAIAIGGYAAHLLHRARRARARVATIAAKRIGAMR